MTYRGIIATVLAGAMTCSPVAAASTSDAALPATVNSSAVAVIPFKVDNESSGDLSGRVLLALFACALVGVGGIYLLRRYHLPGLPISKNRRLQVVEVQRLGVKTSVFLLRWDQEELLLVQGEERTELLARKNIPLTNDVQASQTQGVKP